jgi:hypothetical protein
MEDGDDAHISGAQLYGVPEHDQGQNQRRTDEGVRWLHWLRQKGMASGVVRRGIGITYLCSVSGNPNVSFPMSINQAIIMLRILDRDMSLVISL